MAVPAPTVIPTKSAVHLLEKTWTRRTRRYTPSHGRLLSLPRLSPLLQPAVRPPARQPVPQARPRPGRAEDGRVPARARPGGGQRAGDRRGRRRDRDRAAAGGRGPRPEPGALSRLRATGTHAGREGGRPRAARLAPPRPRPGPRGGGAGRPGGPAPGGVLLSGLCAPASRGRRPCPARPGLQLSTPQPALPGLLRAV